MTGNSSLFCLVGRGTVGTRHVRNLRALSEGNIIALSECHDAAKDEEFKTRYGIETFYSAEEIARRRPDAFIIANPTAKHLQYAEMAADMGCHIFMEKPLSSSTDGIEGLRKTMRDKGLVFLLANNFRFHPVMITLKSLIEKNALGRIYFARIQCGQYLPDWHPGEDYRKGYSARKDLGGGVVLTLQHEIDYAYWLFGEFGNIKSTVKKIGELEIDVEDIASVIIETEAGQIIEVHLDYLQRPPKRAIQVQGAKGSIDYRMGDRHLKLYRFEEQNEEVVLDLQGYDTNQMYIDEMKHFIRCITGMEQTRSSIDDAVYVLNACLEIKKEFMQ